MKAHALLCQEHSRNLRASGDGATVACDEGCVIDAIELKDAGSVFFATADGAMYIAAPNARSGGGEHD